ncbi:MAG: hypothetical protein OXF79_09015 [Chloroflexi bacterium]|nr:hypothetical protein [Chloroflexota bacterium]
MCHRVGCVVTGAAHTVTSRHVWRFLTRIDEDLVARQAREPCPHCGDGRLHRADYPRAAWGLPRDLREGEDVRRFSLCCDNEGCRQRTRPDSVRYFGRRFYAAPLFLLAAVLLARGAPGLLRLGITLSIDRRTLKRWRRWWREAFVQSGFWRERRFDVMPLPGRQPLLGLYDLGRRRRRRFALRILHILHRFRDLATAAG